ncbi:MAG: metalloregulator ArsR/SmtB family transcription factor [Candidatus Promineifilaceae bacterium]|nr:metalloregulator ArsR/SmtB family transcription factor [Candidatus Promineifilaceae bacterium]
MDTEERTEELLAFFKALADANRLKIIGLLAQDSYSVEELAALLALGPSTVSHHLARLVEVGLVSARAESYYNVYRLETDALEAMARRLLAEETLPAVIADVDLNAYDRQVVENYVGPDGRLKLLPRQRKKTEALIRYMIQAFEPGRAYTEQEVNEIISRFHDDTASIRREFIDYQLLERTADGRKYWRPAD